MNDELISATLDKLSTKSWQTCGAKGNGITLAGREVIAFYRAIERRDLAPHLVLGVESMSVRKADRAVQVLKKAGLVVFDKAARCWKVT